MSHQDVTSVVREGLASLAGFDQDLEMIEMARMLADLVRPYAAPGFECILAPMPPTQPVSYPGVDGIERGWKDFSEGFRSVSAEFERIEESDIAVVLFVRQTVVTAHGGVEMSQPGILVVKIDGDRVENVQFHLDRDSALRAGGLSAGPDA